MSSRLIGFPHERWRQEGFRPFMLQELDQKQTDLFLRRWHQLAYRDDSKGERKRASLLQAIQQSPAIQQLAGNPLLLTLMAILNRSQELPRDRGELYSQCARLLLHQWKTEQAFDASPELAHAQLDGKDKLGLMKRIASSVQAGTDGAAGNLTNLIEESQLERTLSEGLQGIPGLRPDRAARALIEQLRGRNFMLCSMGGGNYAFVHRTFLEYFCAEAIVDRFQVEQTLTLDALKTEIFGHWPDETWHEVLRLVAGRLAPRFVKEILDWLLQQQDPNQSCNHIILAARCVCEVRNRRELGSTEESVMQCTRDLTNFGLGSSSPPMTFEEVTQVKAVLEQAVALVADVWKDNKETLPWLKELAQSHQNKDVRSNAVKLLHFGWKDDPDIQMICRELAQSDVSWKVRLYALAGLSLQEHTAATLKILKESSQSDESWFVRLYVVGILSEFVNGDPDLLAIVKERAQYDEDRNVRLFSVQRLEEFWKDDPEIQTFLQGL